jgi:hypothetical protein
MRAKRIRPPERPGRELARLLNAIGHRYPIDRVFRDWLEISAIAISNAVDKRQHAAREARYMTIVGQYQQSEVEDLKTMFHLLVEELEITRECVLSPLISDLELHTGRKRMGQFFTPFHLSHMMAVMTFHPKEDVEKIIAEHGFITAMEPACGAGGMVIAMARALEDLNINFQKHLHVTAVDIDPMCVHMTYLQTSLMGIPAIVVQGDSIRATATEHWFTPMHILYGWGRRLTPGAEQRTHEIQTMFPPPAAEEAVPEAPDFVEIEFSDAINNALAELRDEEPPQVPALIMPASIRLSRSSPLPLEIAPGSTPPYAGD